MAKKIYTTPTLSVEEYEMIVITATSIENFENNAGLTMSKTGGTGTGDSAPHAKGRGIWDEE